MPPTPTTIASAAHPRASVYRAVNVTHIRYCSYKPALPGKFLLATLLLATLTACSGDEPRFTTEVAARHIHSASLSQDGEFALIGAEFHGGSLWQLADYERLFNWNHRQG